jgi:uncharacterized membrane protein
MGKTLSVEQQEGQGQGLDMGLGVPGMVGRLRLWFAGNVADEVFRSENGLIHSIVTAYVAYLRGGGQLLSTYPIIVAIFCAYSCRILVVPLWTATFVPVISPIYKQQLHWLSNRRHFVAILLHVMTGIVCLSVGILQFNSHLRRNYRALHRWTGRLYVLCGIVCLHSLWQLQGVVGKGPGTEPSLSLQVFNIICICLWTAATIIAVYHAVTGNYERHKQWMARSYCILTTPLQQRSANVCISFMLYWVVAAYALVVDSVSCYRPLLAVARSSSGQHWDEVWDCLLSSVPVWPEDGASMLSLEGFGHTEYLVFGLSAWFALGLVVYMSEIGAAAVVFDGGTGESTTVNSGSDAWSSKLELGMEMKVGDAGRPATDRKANKAGKEGYDRVSQLDTTEQEIDSAER